jgi:pimeloyl-ACP methyl ester carboxylesterase
MRRLLVPFACLALMACAPAAHAGWRDVISPSKNWQRIKSCCSSAKNRVTGYCQKKVDTARADQEKLWGLRVPADLNDRRPLVILIHGLDSNSGVWGSMASLIERQGAQVAYFSYPDDGPIQGAADRLAREMAAIHAKFPNMTVSLIGHSMGSLVARAYVEGDAYVHPVRRLIAIAPPNHGSPVTRGRFLLEAHEQYWNWRTQANWSPLWMFTDGNGEAADDLKPDSKFLRSLNARPRRDGVRYTIIAGNQNILARFGAEAATGVGASLPRPGMWGMRQCKSCLAATATRLSNQSGEGDGVVPLASARLDGVSDVVVLKADHNALAMSCGGKAPAAWETIKARLGD